MPAKAPRNPSHRKPGPPRKPKTATEQRLHDHESQTRAERRRVSGKDRRFVQLYVDRGLRDANAAAHDAGFVEPYIGEKLVSRLSHLVESERIRRSMGEQMEVDEALELVADIARTELDAKTRHSALRTVLEVHGVLTGAPRVDRRESMRAIHSLVAAIKEKVGGGAKVKVRGGERETRTETVTVTETALEAEIEQESEGKEKVDKE